MSKAYYAYAECAIKRPRGRGEKAGPKAGIILRALRKSTEDTFTHMSFCVIGEIWYAKQSTWVLIKFL